MSPRAETISEPDLFVGVLQEPFDDRPTVPIDVLILDGLEKILSDREDVLPAEGVREFCDESKEFKLVFNHRVKLRFRGFEYDLLDHALRKLCRSLIVMFNFNILSKNVSGGF